MGFHDRLEAVVEVGYVLLFVMQGDDDRVFRHGLLIIDERHNTVVSRQFSVRYRRVAQPLRKQLGNRQRRRYLAVSICDVDAFTVLSPLRLVESMN